MLIIIVIIVCRSEIYSFQHEYATSTAHDAVSSQQREQLTEIRTTSMNFSWEWECLSPSYGNENEKFREWKVTEIPLSWKLTSSFMSTRVLQCSIDNCYVLGLSNHNKDLSDYVKPKVVKSWHDAIITCNLLTLYKVVYCSKHLLCIPKGDWQRLVFGSMNSDFCIAT